jgi:hypothetical protein
MSEQQSSADSAELDQACRDSDWLALSASEKACYHWPEDTDIHKQCRAAFIDGAAHAHSQAGIEQRHMTQLLTVLEVMKSAHNKEPSGRLMSIWFRDIEAVEAAVAALTRPQRQE